MFQLHNIPVLAYTPPRGTLSLYSVYTCYCIKGTQSFNARVFNQSFFFFLLLPRNAYCRNGTDFSAEQNPATRWSLKGIDTPHYIDSMQQAMQTVDSRKQFSFHWENFILQGALFSWEEWKIPDLMLELVFSCYGSIVQ